MGRGESDDALNGSPTLRGSVTEHASIVESVPEILSLWSQLEEKDPAAAEELLSQPVTIDHPALEGGPVWEEGLKACRALRTDQLEKMDENPDSLVSTVFSGNCAMMLNALRARV